MTLPTHDDGYIIGEGDWNTLVTAVNHATGKNLDQDNWINAHNVDYSALEDRVTATESKNTDQDSALTTLETNQGTRGSNGTVYGEIEALKAGGVEAYTPTQADDTTLYGDMISNLPRHAAWFSEPAGNGYLTGAATVSRKDFTATQMRFGVLAVAAGAGAFEVGLFIGPSQSDLTRVAYSSGTSWLSTTGVRVLSVPDVQINAGDFVALGLLATGWDTPGELAMTPSDGTTAPLISNAGFNVFASYQSGQTALPSTLDMTVGTNANKQTWFALA